MAIPEPIRIGPFVGGLNTASDPSAIQDNDLSLCENFELDLDGALVNRQPFIDTNVDMPLPPDSGAAIKLLGFFSAGQGSHYLIGSDRVSKTYCYTGSSWDLITDELAATAVTQFKDKLWLIAAPGSGQEGGSWNLDTPFAKVIGMPKGESIVANKERLWVVPGPKETSNGARLSYSAVGEPNKWPDTTPAGGGYMSVNEGDGQNAIVLKVYFSDIVIFKTNSVYRFTFGTDPGQGTLSRLSNTIGVSGVDCVAEYESDLYVMHNNTIYLLSNFNFTRNNVKTPLKAVTPTMSLSVPFALSVWNDRLIASYHDTTFVQNLRTKAWNTWKSERVGVIGKVLERPNDPGEERLGYVQDSNLQSGKLYTVSSTVTSDSEPMVCKIRTKIYDYQASHTFKKMAQWGADLIAKDTVIGRTHPIVFNVPSTWDEVAQSTWDQLGPWNNLLGSSISIIDPVEVLGSSYDRKYVRFRHVCRFRQVYFELDFETDGSTVSAPVKLFSLTTFVGSKQSTPRRIN